MYSFLKYFENEKPIEETENGFVINTICTYISSSTLWKFNFQK